MSTIPNHFANLPLHILPPIPMPSQSLSASSTDQNKDFIECCDHLRVLLKHMSKCSNLSSEQRDLLKNLTSSANDLSAENVSALSASGNLAISEQQAEINRLVGISEDQFRKYTPKSQQPPTTS